MEVYEFKGRLVNASENRKALVVFIQLYKLFKEDFNFHLDTFRGRINLYCLLLIHKLGKTTIENHMKKCSSLSENPNRIHFYAASNMIMPNTFAELNLRTRYLWGSTTSIHTLAVEGGHRQTCCVFNELNIEMKFNPIKSFFDITTPTFMTHRKAAVDIEDTMDRADAFQSASLAYYERERLEVRSNLYCLNDSCNGLTKKLTKKLCDWSAQIAVDNEQQANKTIEVFLAEVVEKISTNKEMISPYIPPMEVPDTIKNPNPHGTEKYPIYFIRHNIRWFFENLAMEAAKPSSNTKLKNINTKWNTDTLNCLTEWLNQKNKAKFTSMTKAEKKPKSAKSKKGNKVEEKEVIHEIHTFIENFLNRQEERKQQPNQHYLDYSYDPFITEKSLFLRKDLDITNVSNPTRMEWFYGFWATWSTPNSDVSEAPEKVGNWKPAPYVTFGMSFGYSVYNQDTCRDFAKMLKNNGDKETSLYKGQYCHEIGHKDFHFVVSKIIFRMDNPKLFFIHESDKK